MYQPKDTRYWEIRAEMERGFLRELLNAAEGVVTVAAQLVGATPPFIYLRIRKLRMREELKKIQTCYRLAHEEETPKGKVKKPKPRKSRAKSKNGVRKRRGVVNSVVNETQSVETAALSLDSESPTE